MKLKKKSLPNNWKDLMRNEAEEGGVETSFCLVLGISLNDFLIMLGKNNDLRDHFKLCKTISEEWWFRAGKDLVSGGQGNAKIWSSVMAHAFAWESDVEEADLITAESMTDEEILAELKGLNVCDDLVNLFDKKNANKEPSR